MLPFVRMLEYGNIAPEPKPLFKNRLQANYNTRFYLHVNGDLYWYGSSSFGQGGNGSLQSSTVWTRVNNNIERYWGGVLGSIAIKNDGTIWFTGASIVMPQIGTNTNGVWIDVTQYFTDFGVSADDIDGIAVGQNLRVFLKNGKWFYCGAGEGGVFGNASTANVTSFRYSTIENVKSYGCSLLSTGLVLDDGSYWYAGNTVAPGSTKTSNILSFTKDNTITNAIQAVNTYRTSYIFLNDGSVKVASPNAYGQAGVGTVSAVPMSTLIPNLSFQGEIELVGGLSNNEGNGCVVKNNNKLYTCGRNTYGACGVNQTSENILTFTEMVLDALEGRRISGFVIDNFYSMIIDENNNLYMSGLPELGNVPAVRVPTRVPDSLLPWK
ncbi:TPA: hypothetical protein OGU99_000652 [Escherichia coli]|nr:hypothetical protein [Escherichia coli]